MSQIIIREIPNKKLDIKLNPLLEHIYLTRGIALENEINYQLAYLLPFENLSGIDKAAGILYEALLLQQKIIIIGDFDTDGATSTALAVKALKAFGFNNISYLVPNRFLFGYGLTAEIVKVAAERRPDIIITVDNGISSNEGVDAAISLGMKVIITDHHLPGENIPNAHAIINPNQSDDNFGSKNLAGVGVIFYLMLALRKFLREKNWFSEKQISEPNMSNLLDLVALGTVADVVHLDTNNRIMVSHGLKRIQSGQCCIGILSLLKLSNRDNAKICAKDLAYTLTPRLNAAGRLDDMSLGIECLLTEDQEKAKKIAIELDTLNKERRAIEVKMQKDALTALSEVKLNNKELPLGLCLLKENWHQGVLGILASRLKDLYQRPVIIFTRINENELKGSARSVADVHIRDILFAIASKYPNLLSKFGGHAMAAGLSIDANNYQEFCKAFNVEIEKIYAENDFLTQKIYIDAELLSDDLNIDTADLIRNAGPWGRGFPEPLFGGSFNVIQYKTIGDRHLKLTVNPLNTTKIFDAILFNNTEILTSIRDNVYLVYSLDINEYRGVRKLQLIVENIILNPEV